ncbi:MAG: hypothetical protein FJX15_13745 [Alphaproteobacteria bacterium]|nr:hypothetical protein [Alphaproteobacteria bacterium]
MTAADKRAKDGSRRGGARPGAGRKKAETRSPTAINSVDLAAALETPAPAEIDAALNGQSRRSLDGLVKLMLHASSDSARISAAEEILDRGYGKPAVDIGGDAAMPTLPFMMAPEPTLLSISTVRAEAKRYANLAVLVLQKIAENSLSETARVSAHRALIKRECGTVGMARMTDQQRDRPLGKKEQAARAAEAAASGLYAPRRVPRSSDSLQ